MCVVVLRYEWLAFPSCFGRVHAKYGEFCKEGIQLRDGRMPLKFWFTSAAPSRMLYSTIAPSARAGMEFERKHGLIALFVVTLHVLTQSHLEFRRICSNLCRYPHNERQRCSCPFSDSKQIGRAHV